MRCPVHIAAGYGILVEILRDFSRFIQASGDAILHGAVVERGSAFYCPGDLISKSANVFVVIRIDFISFKLKSVLIYVLIQKHKGQL